MDCVETSFDKYPWCSFHVFSTEAALLKAPSLLQKALLVLLHFPCSVQGWMR